jgi:UTP--glucose-1-phosphate uridylyltransferase
MAKVTKAIIALAGLGGRRVPITKAIEKCMIPVGNRPIVDYLVDACIAAGITDIIFVVGEQSHQIRTFYGHNQMLEDYLVQNHKLDALEEISNLKTKARFHFVTQGADQPYGTSTPLWLARDYVREGERFLYLYGDNMHYRADGGSVIADFVQEALASGVETAMMVNEVPHDQVYRYGVVATDERDGKLFFRYIHEKPKVEEAPSNLNNSGVFILNHEILDKVRRSMEDTSHERYVIDAINYHHEDGHDIVVVRSTGQWLDCGSVEGWLYANNVVVGGMKPEEASHALGP